MKAPDKIFLNRRHPEPYWFEDKQLDSDIEYICKDALLEWAKQKQYDSDTIVQDDFWQEVIDKLNEM